MFQTLHGPGRGRRRRRLPAPRDRAGLVRQLQERPADDRARRSRSASPRSARASGTRSRPATSCSGCASSSRWRCSTSSAPTTAAADLRGVAARAAGPGTRRYGVTPDAAALPRARPDELAHYAKKAIDVEYRFPFGWKELEGIHNRGDFDLGRHAAGDAARTSSTSTRRPRSTSSPGSSRRRRAPTARRSRSSSTPTARRRCAARSASSSALHPELAPYKVAVLPLLKKRPEIVELCHRIRADLRARHDGRLRRHRGRSASCTAARTRSARRGASPSTSSRSTTAR